MVCLTCGRFVHYKEGCPEKKPMGETNSIAVNNRVQQNHDSTTNEKASAGPWQVVQKQRKENKEVNDRKNQASGTNYGPSMVGSRLVMLSKELP